MRVLTEIAVISFLVLLGMAVWLWRSLRRESAPKSEPLPKRHARVPHPRADLAVGMVPPEQTVRRRAATRDADPQQDTHVPHPGERPDRAYFNGDFGDLSDPDPRKVAAVGSRRPGYVPESY